MQIKAIKTRIFKENEDLGSFVLEHVKKIPEKSILVLSSKIVSLSEGRTATNSKENKQKLIKLESDFSLPNSWFSIKDGMILPAAGIDESNGQGKLILLPKDSFQSANKLRKSLQTKFKIKNLGIIVTDSNFLPLRKGAIGVAISYAGFAGIRNYIGKKDIFDRVLKFSSTNIPDSLATAAVLCMGEGNEKQPIVVINDAPVNFQDKINKLELRMNPKKDMFYPLFKNIYGAKKKKTK